MLWACGDTALHDGSACLGGGYSLHGSQEANRKKGAIQHTPVTLILSTTSYSSNVPPLLNLSRVLTPGAP